MLVSRNISKVDIISHNSLVFQAPEAIIGNLRGKNQKRAFPTLDKEEDVLEAIDEYLRQLQTDTFDADNETSVDEGNATSVDEGNSTSVDSVDDSTDGGTTTGGAMGGVSAAKAAKKAKKKAQKKKKKRKKGKGKRDLRENEEVRRVL
jgi:hypothetical protein